MDLNNNIQNVDELVSEISEQDCTFDNVSMITEEMVLESIKNNIGNNRQLNRNINLTIYDLHRRDIMDGVEDSEE